MQLVNVAIFFIRLIVGTVLAAAGFLKLQQHSSNRFLKNVLAYDLVKGYFARVTAKSLPWLEISCGLFLLTGLFLPTAALASFSLLLIFTFAVATAIVRDKKVSCGCFGRTSLKDRIRWHITYRNLILMGLLIIVFAYGPGWLTVDNWLSMWTENQSVSRNIQNGLILIWSTTLLFVAILHLITRKRVRAQKEQSAI